MLQKVLLLIVVALVAAGAVYYFVTRDKKELGNSALSVKEEKEKPLEKYTIEALSKTTFAPVEITLGETLEDNDDFTSYMFYFHPEGRKVSGLINVPKISGPRPVIVMFRGYVDKEEYKTGVGTSRSADFFAKGGYITMAPDFLGYGESDNPSEDPVEERFQTYITALTLLESAKNLNRADKNKVFIWGHSNGGQIALTVLEITGKNIPTVLWAPVSKPFPYSVLYYTDEFDDRGKMLRRVIADFEKDYDADKYSLTGYFDRIKAPISLHQGTADESVPLRWSDQLADELEKLDKDIEYFTYAGENHNFTNGTWQTAVSRSLAFFETH